MIINWSRRDAEKQKQREPINALKWRRQSSAKIRQAGKEYERACQEKGQRLNHYYQKALLSQWERTCPQFLGRYWEQLERDLPKLEAHSKISAKNSCQDSRHSRSSRQFHYQNSRTGAQLFGKNLGFWFYLRCLLDGILWWKGARIVWNNVELKLRKK